MAFIQGQQGTSSSSSTSGTSASSSQQQQQQQHSENHKQNNIDDSTPNLTHATRVSPATVIPFFFSSFSYHHQHHHPSLHIVSSLLHKEWGEKIYFFYIELGYVKRDHFVSSYAPADDFILSISHL